MLRLQHRYRPFGQNRCLYHIDLEERIGGDTEATTQYHIRQELLPCYYAPITSADTLDNYSYDAWRGCHQLLRQLLRIFEHGTGACVYAEQRRNGLHRR